MSTAYGAACTQHKVKQDQEELLDRGLQEVGWLITNKEFCSQVYHAYVKQNMDISHMRLELTLKNYVGTDVTAVALFVGAHAWCPGLCLYDEYDRIHHPISPWLEYTGPFVEEFQTVSYLKQIRGE